MARAVREDAQGDGEAMARASTANTVGGGVVLSDGGKGGRRAQRLSRRFKGDGATSGRPATACDAPGEAATRHACARR